MTVLPLCSFPPISWMAHAVQTEVCIDVYEHFEKQTYRSRFDVQAANGPLSLSLAVQSTQGKKTPLCDMRLASGPWRKNHWTSLRSAYGKSAFFDYVEHELHELFTRKDLEFLIDFNQNALAILQPFFKTFEPVYSTAYIEKDTPLLIDLRDQWKPPLPKHTWPSYTQVFCDRHAFMADLSALDLIMNKGPMAADYLKQLPIQQ
jgi:hypothetical protein